MIAADKGTRKIAVETKTFSGVSEIADLEAALGQYILYRMALRLKEPDRELYLAVPTDIAENQLQQEELWEAFLSLEQGKIFGYDTEQERITLWLP